MGIQQTTYAVPRADLAEALLEFNPANDGFIATQVLPTREVSREAATISVLTRENLQLVDVKHKDGANYARGHTIAEDKAYACENYGYEEPLTDKSRMSYRYDFDAEMEVMNLVMRKLLIAQEVRAAAAVFNTTTWPSGTAALYTSWTTAPWDVVGSDAITHILTAKEKVRANCGQEPDSMVISAATMNALLNNTGILARFPAAVVLTEAMLRANMASIFGLQNLFVGKQIYTSAKEGQAYSGTDIWSKDYAMIFKISTGSFRAGGLGRTLVWSDMGPELIADQRPDDNIKGDIFRVEQYVDELIFDPYYGHLLFIDAD